MKNWNISFEKYANGMWITFAKAKFYRKVLRLYIEDCLRNNKECVLGGIVSFKVKKSTTALFPGKKFIKVVAKVPRSITYLFKEVNDNTKGL